MSFWNGKVSLYIGGKENPYLLRWHILKLWHLPRIYLHKFLRSDDDRALHDHPWWFISILLWGKYWEFYEKNGQTLSRLRRAPSIAFRGLKTKHRVLLDNTTPEAYKPVWTLIVTGPDVRGWGFFCGDRKVPWREFDGCGESR